MRVKRHCFLILLYHFEKKLFRFSVTKIVKKERGEEFKR